jgi:hypothetical protein
VTFGDGRFPARCSVEDVQKNEESNLSWRSCADIFFKRRMRYGSNCNVKLIAMDKVKPSSNAKSHDGTITACLRS